MNRFEQIKSFTLEQMVAFLNENTDCRTCSRKTYDNCRDITTMCRVHIKEWLESEGEIDGIL